MSRDVARAAEKRAWRERIWSLLEDKDIATFPRPVHGRIPNFKGSEQACTKLTSLDVWRRAHLIKINPDAPQRCLRARALKEGKTLIMPTPRLREGFLLLDPRTIPPRLYGKASTIRGAFSLGRRIGLKDLVSLGPPDLIIEGSVVVNRWGERLGKGEGYGELEYGILSELGLASEETPIATTVHDLQVVEEHLPQDPWDVPLDLVVTPTRVIKCNRTTRPKGVLWELLPQEKLSEIFILRELKNTLEGKKTE